MKTTRLLRAAWAGAAAAAIAAFAYLAFAPIPSSHAVDTVLTLAVAAAGAVTGVWIASRIPRSAPPARDGVEQRSQEGVTAG